MPRIEVSEIKSLAEFLERSIAWNDLWQRSDVANPMVRCELVAHWVRQFSSERSFRALLVHQAGELVCALPLVKQRRKKLVPVLTLPNNEWAMHGDLLLDPHCDRMAVLDALVRGMGCRCRRLLWLEAINLAEERWQDLLAALDRADWSFAPQPLDTIATIDLSPDWESYTKSLSRNTRHNARRSLKKLSAEGVVTLRRETFQLGRERDAAALAASVKRAFEVENRSWKGPLGTTILQSPGMWEFFLQVAQVAAAADTLELDCLELEGEPVAFEFGYRSKGTFFCHKISFDEAYAGMGPSRILRQLQLEQFFADPDVRKVDYMGSITNAVESWANGTYEASRLVAGAPNWWSQLLFTQYERYRQRQEEQQQEQAESLVANEAQPAETATDKKCLAAQTAPPEQEPTPV